MDTFFWSLAASLLAIVISLSLLIAFYRFIITFMVKRFLSRLLTDVYIENLWELVSAIRRSGAQNIFENSLRAEFGSVIERPLGSPRSFLHFDGLMFNPAQLHRFPVAEDVDVDTKVTIGPKAKKPLQLDIPLLVAGFGYGVGFSKKAKLALAKGASQVGTATNSGEGPFLQEERDAAKYFIMQYHRGDWGKDASFFKQSDAVEIHMGQGATAGVESVTSPKFLTEEARQLMGIKAGEPAVVRARFPGMHRTKDFKSLVTELKNVTGGVPVGIKMIPSLQLERDMELAIDAGVDFIVLDGAQAATKGSPPILEDDFGLPTVYALSRAVRFLEEKGAKGRVSLIVSGGLSQPGHYLKALALGADAVYVGSALMFAMTHVQVVKSVPWENPLELVLDSGKKRDQFDAEEAERCVVNFFTSSMEEMKTAVRALGKKSICDVDRSDLCSLDPWTSEVTGIGLCYGKKS